MQTAYVAYNAYRVLYGHLWLHTKCRYISDQLFELVVMSNAPREAVSNILDQMEWIPPVESDGDWDACNEMIIHRLSDGDVAGRLAIGAVVREAVDGAVSKHGEFRELCGSFRFQQQ